MGADVNDDGEIEYTLDAAGGGGGGGAQPPVATAAGAAGDDRDDLVRRLEQLEAMVRENLFPIEQAAASGGGVVVKVTGNATGGGKYTGRILTGTSTAVATGNLSMPEGLTAPGADDALVLNVYESTTHDLGSGTFHVGVACGTSAGKTVVVIQALKGNSC